MAGFPDNSSGKLSEKEEWQEELKMEFAILKQNEGHSKEEQRESNAEAALLKEEHANALENEKGVNRLTHERVLAQLQQENNVEVEDIGEAPLSRLGKQALIASIESKELVNTELQSELCRVKKDLENTQDGLRKSNEREEVKISEVKKLEKRCNEFFSQITRLVHLQQESEAEIKSLKQRVAHLEEENEMLSITNQLFSLD